MEVKAHNFVYTTAKEAVSGQLIKMPGFRYFSHLWAMKCHLLSYQTVMPEQCKEIKQQLVYCFQSNYI